MKKKFWAGLAIGLLGFGAAGIVSATSLTVQFDFGTINSTTALTGYPTTGAMMDGMTVRATFTNGDSESLLWADIVPSFGGVSGTGWRLFQGGDTGDIITPINWWTLESFASAGTSISRLFFDAGAGDSVFDTFFGGQPGTDGSILGTNFTITSTNEWDITATYIDAVALTGQAPVGDLYRCLAIDFAGAGFGPGSTLSFGQDTDSLQDITSNTPEPATMLLFGTGIAGLIGTRLRRKKNNK